MLYLDSKQLPVNRVPGDQIIDITRKLIAEQEERKRSNGAAFPLEHVSTFRGDDIAIPWAIDGIIEQRGHTTIFGASESYKTFLALSMGACMASGTEWHGHPVNQCGVAYIVGEGHSGIMQRIMAWETHYGISLDDYPFYLSSIPAQLTLEDDAVSISMAIENIENVGAVFIDTMSRNFGPGNENSTQDMAQYIGLIDRHLRNPYSAAIVHVHHSGLLDTTRGRGSGVLRAAMESEFMVERLGDSITFSCSKMKNAEHPPGMQFAPLEVELSKQGKDGMPIKSIVLEYDGEPDTANKGMTKGLGPNQLKAKAILTGLYADHRKRLGDTEAQPRVLYDDWKRACRKERLDRNQFRDAAKGLGSRKIIFRTPPYVYLAGKEGESV
jgi:hypothetical protein